MHSSHSLYRGLRILSLLYKATSIPLWCCYVCITKYIHILKLILSNIYYNTVTILRILTSLERNNRDSQGT